jgi:hypothetical protein
MAAPARVDIRRVSLRNSAIRYHATEDDVTLEMADTNLTLCMPAP